MKKKKVRKVRLSSKKKAVVRKKSTVAPKKKKVAKKKVAKKTVAKRVVKAKKVKVEKTEPVIATTPEVVTAPVEKPASKRPVKYLNNRDLLAQVLLSKKQGKMTNELAKMLQLLTSRYAKKGNFANYTYNEDMQSYAMLMIVKTWQGFDPAKSSNPFAWFTQCVKNSFIQYLNYEQRQRDVRDEVLINSGLNPSFGYSYDYEDKNGDDAEVVEAPTKLHEDISGFDSISDTQEDNPPQE